MNEICTSSECRWTPEGVLHDSTCERYPLPQQGDQNERQRPSWDAYFLAFAKTASLRATCPRKSVGAVIVVGAAVKRGVLLRPASGECAARYGDVYSGGHVAATGYNGSIAGMSHCTEVGCNLSKDQHCTTAVHAEANALMQAARHGIAVEGATIYTTASPCWPCFMLLASAGIKRFVYAEEYRAEEHRTRIAAVAEKLGIEVVKFAP